MSLHITIKDGWAHSELWSDEKRSLLDTQSAVYIVLFFSYVFLFLLYFISFTYHLSFLWWTCYLPLLFLSLYAFLVTAVSAFKKFFFLSSCVFCFFLVFSQFIPYLNSLFNVSLFFSPDYFDPLPQIQSVIRAFPDKQYDITMFFLIMISFRPLYSLTCFNWCF